VLATYEHAVLVPAVHVSEHDCVTVTGAVVPENTALQKTEDAGQDVADCAANVEESKLVPT